MTPYLTRRTPASWLYAFALVQFICQASLVAPIGSTRIGFRIAAFASSIAMLLLPTAGRPHPVRPFALCVVVLTCLNFFHPSGNTPLARLGQVALVSACWAPVFWVGRIRITSMEFRRLLLIVWGYNCLSAGVAVLQTYDERFSPDPEFLRQTVGADLVEQLKITLDDGRKVFRPMGLSDSPGGGGLAGSFAALGSLGILAAYRNWALRVAAIPAGAIGMYAIYMSQVRLSLIVTGLGATFIISLLAARGRFLLAGGLAASAALAALTGYAWASTVGENVISERLSSLTEESAGQVYYQNRGRFLESTFEIDLPQYPFGAGLGRYGMMYSYFGDKLDPDTRPLWAEIQITAWVYDGGVILLAVALTAFTAGCWTSYKIAVAASDDGLRLLAAVVTAINVGVAATLISSHVFTTQAGIMFWVLNAALYAAQPPRLRPVAPHP